MGRAHPSLAAVAVAAALIALPGRVTAKDVGGAPASAAAIPWQWHEEAGPPGRAFSITLEGGTSIDVARARDGKIVGLRKFGSTGGELWSAPLLAPAANDVALLYHDGTLYVGLYAESATGAEIAAVDAKSGHLLFRTPLRGLGSVHHGKVRNRVQLRFVAPWVVAFGDESARRYIEALDAKTGATVSSRKLRP